MIISKLLRHVIGLAAVAVLTIVGGCATQPAVDYSAFKASKPASVLVLPPMNESPEVQASDAVLAQLTMPLAESGYYVIPVAVARETFRQNGMTQPAEIQALPIAKLREIFGADAALYIKVQRYGTSYFVIGSESAVAMEGKLVDLRDGKELWSSKAVASSAEGRSSGGGLAGLLITALASQILDSIGDESFRQAGIASQRFVSGMLPGPYAPNYAAVYGTVQ